jgi:integrase
VILLGFLKIRGPNCETRAKEIKRKNSILDRVILLFIGHINVSELNSNLILTTVLKPIDERKQSETLKRARFLLSQIFRYGATLGKIDRDFTQDYKGFFAPSVVVRRATILDKKKIGKLILDIRTYTGSINVSYALKILPYVFVHPGELRHAEWSEIDFQDKLWRIPAGKMKMRSQHVVPLFNQVVALLQELRQYTGQGKYLFPGLRAKTKPISDMAINSALRYLGYGKEEICGHGFRSMASTLLNEKCYGADWIERQLAHTQQNGVRAAYNHAEYLPERRKMMQEWADYLDHLAEEAKRN